MVGQSTDRKAPTQQPRTGPTVHDDGVAQGVTDGHITVKGHHCQEDKLHCPRGKKEVCLGDTASKRYGFPVL